MFSPTLTFDKQNNVNQSLLETICEFSVRQLKVPFDTGTTLCVGQCVKLIKIRTPLILEQALRLVDIDYVRW